MSVRPEGSEKFTSRTASGRENRGQDNQDPVSGVEPYQDTLPLQLSET